MTRQEMFNKAYLGVIKQGGPAVQSNHNTDGLMCSYLAPSGRMCAVGHIMTEEELKVMGAFRGGVQSLADEWADCLAYPEWLLGNENLEFLNHLQDTHDNLMEYDGTDFVESYKSDMAKFAAFYNLTVPELEQE
jgi:hypothetical protein